MIDIDLGIAQPVEKMICGGAWGFAGVGRVAGVLVGYNNTSLTSAYTTATGVSSLTTPAQPNKRRSWIVNLSFAPQTARYWRVQLTQPFNSFDNEFTALYNVELWAKNAQPSLF